MAFFENGKLVYELRILSGLMQNEIERKTELLLYRKLLKFKFLKLFRRKYSLLLQIKFVRWRAVCGIRSREDLKGGVDAFR